MAGGSGSSVASPTILAQTNGASKVGYDGAEATVKLALDALYSTKADLDSPELTGTPTAPTAAKATSTTQLATTSFVHSVAADYLSLAGGEMTGDVQVSHGLGISDPSGNTVFRYWSTDIRFGNKISSPELNFYTAAPTGYRFFKPVQEGIAVDVTADGLRLGGANIRVNGILDEDDFASDSATALATQQSIGAKIAASDVLNAKEIASASLSGLSAVDVDLSDAGSYDYLLLELDKAVASAVAQWDLLFSNDGGATFENGASAYGYDCEGLLDAADDSILLSGSGSKERFTRVLIEIHEAESAGVETTLAGFTKAGLVAAWKEMGGYRTVAEVNDYLRLSLSTGTWTGGTIRLLGVGG